MDTKVVEVLGDQSGNVIGVKLVDGKIIEGDLVLCAAGVLPATRFLAESGIERDVMGGIICDPFLKTSVPDIYAAGDIASYPYWYSGRRLRLEHWGTAQD